MDKSWDEMTRWERSKAQASGKVVGGRAYDRKKIESGEMGAWDEPLKRTAQRGARDLSALARTPVGRGMGLGWLEQVGHKWTHLGDAITSPTEAALGWLWKTTDPDRPKPPPDLTKKSWYEPGTGKTEHPAYAKSKSKGKGKPEKSPQEQVYEHILKAMGGGGGTGGAGTGGAGGLQMPGGLKKLLEDYSAQARAATREAQGFRRQMFGGSPTVQDRWFMPEDAKPTQADYQHASYLGNDQWAEQIHKGMHRVGQISGTHGGALEPRDTYAPWHRSQRDPEGFATEQTNLREAGRGVMEELERTAGMMRTGAGALGGSSWAAVMEDSLQRAQMGQEMQMWKGGLMSQILGLDLGGSEKNIDPLSPAGTAAKAQQEAWKKVVELLGVGQTSEAEALLEEINEMWGTSSKKDPDATKY